MLLFLLSALQKAAANTSEEGVCRSARGALWVIRTTPDRPQSSCSGCLILSCFITIFNLLSEFYEIFENYCS